VIELRGASKLFPASGTQEVGLYAVDLVVREGEFLALLGPAGSGKSTLLSLIGCMAAPSHGEVVFRGTSIASLREDARSQLRLKSIGFMFPSHYLIEELSVRENVELPLIYAGVTRKRHERSTRLLTEVGMLDRADELAAGMRPSEMLNVALARALINDPVLIVADEPTRAVGWEGARRLLGTLRSLSKQGRTIVLATDDENVADAASRVVRMGRGTFGNLEPQAASEVAGAAPSSTPVKRFRRRIQEITDDLTELGA
jgi:putative ABC transport system ATP-binding protein